MFLQYFQVSSLAARRVTTVIASVVLAALAYPSIAAANMITNGNFSTNDSSYTTFPGYGTPPAWTGTGGVNGPDTGFYKTTSNNLPFSPANGNINGNSTDFAFIQGPGNSLSQTMATTVGQAYTLTYYGAARAGENDILETILTDTIAKKQIGTQVPAIVNTGWTRFTLNFTATSTSTSVEFLNNSASNSSGTVDVTDVVMTPAMRPRAVVGVYYFDGWASACSGHLTNGLLTNPAFAKREPLSGWLDNTPQRFARQLVWAHQDGISFFVFDWYYHHGSHPLNLNNALRQYQQLRQHSGVHYALLYVNIGSFAVSPRSWRAVATRWTMHCFKSPNYQRIDGRPVLVIIDIGRFARQFAGYDGAHGRAQSINRALAVLQKVAKAHGLPGVYVVAGVLWGSAYPHAKQFPDFSWLRAVHVNAITEYNYPYGGGVFNGPRSFRYVMRFAQWAWARFAAGSPRPYIPVVMDGWDPRAWNERMDGKLVWYKRTPAEFGEFVGDAIQWEEHHPAMRVAPPPHRPLLLVEAWNELGEGSYMVPTVGDGNKYGRALAQALGLGDPVQAKPGEK